jgi:hypothetical protein
MNEAFPRVHLADTKKTLGHEVWNAGSGGKLPILYKVVIALQAGKDHQASTASEGSLARLQVTHLLPLTTVTT